MSTLKDTAKHSAIYSFGNLAVKLAGLLMFPVITENLNIAEYGSYSLIESVNQILVGVLSLKLPIAALRLASNYEDNSRQKGYFTNALLLLLGISMLVAALAYLLQSPLSQLLTGEPDRHLLIALLASSVVAEILGLVPIQYFRLKDRSITFVSLSIIKLTVLVTMIFWLVGTKKYGIEGLVGSFLAAHAAFLVAALIMLYWQREPFRPSTAQMKAMAQYGAPLVLTSVITILLATSDRFIIRHFHQFSDIGVYGTSAKIAGVVNFMILNAFFLGFTSIAFKRHEEPEFKRLQPVIIRFISWLVMLAIWFLSLFSEPILELLTKDDDYLLAHLYIPYFGVIIGFAGLQNFLAMAFHFAHKTKKNVPIVFVALVVNIILAVIFVPIHAIYGALGSSIGALVVMLILTYQNGVKVYRDFVGLGNLVRIMTVIIGGAALCVVAIHAPFFKSMISRVFLYPVMCFAAMLILGIKPKSLLLTLRSWF